MNSFDPTFQVPGHDLTHQPAQPLEIRLDGKELLMAANVGLARNHSSIVNNRKPSHGWKGPAWNIHIEGACAEMAVAKVMRCYWNGSIDTFKQQDLLYKDRPIQVRSSTNPDSALIVRDDDYSAHCYILVTGEAPAFIIRGFILGDDAKQDKFRKSPLGRPPAYFVPQDQLRDIRKLL